MTQKQAIQLFEERKVRTVWDDETGKWYVSIVDVVGVLTESTDPSAYWRKLKQRLKAEGNETVTNCHGLKLLAHDGKMRLTDALVSGLPDRIDKAKKGDKLNAYLTSVSYLERGQNIIMEQYDNYHSDVTELSIQWEKKWMEFMVNCDMNTMRLLSMPMTPEKRFYSEIAPLFIVTDKNLFKCSTGEKMIDALNRVIFSPHIFTNQIIETSYIFRELKSLMTQIEDSKRMYTHLFLDDVMKIEDGLEKFRSAIDFYRSQKMKRFA